MYKKLISVFILLAFSSVFAFGQEGAGNGMSEDKPSEYFNLLTGNGDETVKIERKKLTDFAKDYLKAVEKGDAEKVYSYMNPVFVKKLGGKENALQFIKKELENVRQNRDVSSLKLENGELIKQTGEPFNRMAIKIKVADSNSEVETQFDGFLIPIPSVEKEKQEIYFLHIEGLLTSFTPSDCNFAYQKPKPKEKPSDDNKVGGNGSGKGQGIGSGSGSGTGSGSGRDMGNKPNSTDKNPPPPPISSKTGETSGIEILNKPKPEYPFLAKLKNVRGTVVLRVTFLDNGTIGAISPVSGLPCGLTERAITAAKQLKFAPAKKTGTAYSVNKTLQYDFNLYDSEYENFANILN